jgi:WD40 repeat protein
VAFSPDGKTVALWSVKEKKSLLLCDADTGAPRRELPFKQSGAVNEVAFTPDGNSLIVENSIAGTTPRTHHLARISLADGRPQWIATTHLRFVGDLQISPDGSLIGVSGDDADGGYTVRVFNAADGSTRFSLKRKSTDRELDFSPDGLLATTGPGGYCELRDTAPAEMP